MLHEVVLGRCFPLPRSSRCKFPTFILKGEKAILGRRQAFTKEAFAVREDETRETSEQGETAV